MLDEVVGERGFVLILWDYFWAKTEKGNRVFLKKRQIEHIGGVFKVETLQSRVHAIFRPEVRYARRHRCPCAYQKDNAGGKPEEVNQLVQRRQMGYFEAHLH